MTIFVCLAFLTFLALSLLLLFTLTETAGLLTGTIDGKFGSMFRCAMGNALSLCFAHSDDREMLAAITTIMPKLVAMMTKDDERALRIGTCF